MAISPPSDIVLDVARAVEPAELEAARTRLMSIAGGKGGDDFSSAIDASSIRQERLSRAGSQAPAPDAFVRFEAMILQNFVEKMLPREAENVYGSGLAGEMWKSFLAQEIGMQMARAGGIGISERILGAHYMDGDRKVPVAGIEPDGEGKQAWEAQSLLSTALLQEIQRTVVGSLTETAGALTGVTSGE